jgi:hypothetical protein
MTDVSGTGFPSPIIAQTYLSHAAPETVYAWLKANAREVRFLATSPFPDELLTALLARNDLIINLGVASVATEPEILRNLWKSGDRAVRNAIAGNPYRDLGLLGTGHHEWVQQDELIAALQQGDHDFVKLWCTNPALNSNELKEAFAREGIYGKLSEEHWVRVIYWALQNPNLTGADHPAYRGDDYPAYRAAWSLLLTLPNTRTNASFLCERYSKLNTFVVDYEALLDEKRADFFVEREKWQKQQREGEVLFLRRVFERWSAAASDDPNAWDKDGDEANGFQRLRQDVAAAVADRGGDIQNFLKNHEDVYVRLGYYRAGRFPNAVELQASFEKDGKNFLEAAVYNENLYASSPKGLRTAFRHLVKNHPHDEDFPVPSFTSPTRVWDHQASQLFERDPARFPDPNTVDDVSPTSKAGRVARTAARWTWGIATNIFYALVVWYVLSNLRGHPENIIVPVLGLIYVALRTGGVSLGQITLQQFLALNTIYEKLRSMSDARYTRNPSEREAIEQMRFKLTGDAIIETVSLSIISLICLWFLFSAL